MYEIDRKSLGNIGEDTAAKLLSCKGYRIITRNYRCRYGDVTTPISIQSNDKAYPLKSLIPRGLADKSNCSRFKTVSYPIPKPKKTE